MKPYLRGTEGAYRVEFANKSIFPDAIGVVPVDIAVEDYPYLKVTDSTDALGNPIKVISVDSTAKATGEAEKTKASDISTAYQTMSDEVDAKMYEVFRTLKSDYASAEYETWQDMIKRPEAYDSLGLKIDHQLNNADDTELYSPGSALDSAAKITAYAARKIVLAEEYGVYRVQRIQQFKNEKETITNS